MSSLAEAVAAKEELKMLVDGAGRPETNKLYRTVCRWWSEIEVLIVTGATTGKVEANNTGIKHIKRTARGYRNPANYKSVILMRSASGPRHDTHPGFLFPQTVKSRFASGLLAIRPPAK
ncbi:transposase [Arthrobacter sp. NPDC056886]|uniref:transposase n=1 Tax=Arthrobacter sp. NPDC056886 TaxID=3345960 RepID=UPI003670D023